MKIIWITLLLMFTLMGLALGINLLLGFNFTKAIIELIIPLRVMEPIEFVVVILYVLTAIISAVYSGYKNKKSNKI